MCSGDFSLKGYIEERAVEIAEYIIETKATVRQTAKKFGISKSTVHIDCFLQALFGEKCKIFLENVASPNWRKLQSLDRQLFCQP